MTISTVPQLLLWILCLFIIEAIVFIIVGKSVYWFDKKLDKIIQKWIDKKYKEKNK